MVFLRRLWIFAVLLIFTCSGCLSANELLDAPRPGVLAQRLQAQIDALLLSEYRAGAPVSGDNRQFLQMRDLDEDGLEEALLFLRSTADPNQRSVMLFGQRGEDYIRLGTVTVVATDIQSISYADLDGDGLQEVLVGWSTENLSTLSIYALRDNELVEISVPIQYQQYALCKLRGTDSPGTSIVTLRVDAAELRGVAEMYDCVNGSIVLSSTAGLSQNVGGVLRCRVGLLRDGVPGIYIASRYVPPSASETLPSTSEVTDILCFRDESLLNVTLNMETGVSGRLVRPWQVSAADINRDGVLDLAQMVQLPLYPQSSDSETEQETLYEYLWYSYDSTGLPEFVARTYHSLSGTRHWYIVLGDNWPERYTVRRSTTGTAASVTFYFWPDEEADPVSMFTISSISRTAGDTSDIKGRIILDETTTHVIVGEIFELAHSLRGYALSENELKSMFSLVEIDWR